MAPLPGRSPSLMAWVAVCRWARCLFGAQAICPLGRGVGGRGTGGGARRCGACLRHGGGRRAAGDRPGATAFGIGALLQRGGGATRDLARGICGGAAGGAGHATDTGRDACHAGRPGGRLSQLVGGRSGRPHRRARADGGKTAASDHASPGKRRPAGEHGRAHRGARRAEGGTGAELRRAGNKARSDAGAEDTETEQRKGAQHLRHGGGKVRFLTLKTVGERSEQRRADSDDDGEHYHLDAGGNHVAENPFGEERRLVPEREGHQHEARERRQFELEHRDEELDRQDEEGDEDQEPGQQQDENSERVAEDVREADEIADLIDERIRRLIAGGGDLAGFEQIVGGERTGRGLYAETGEGSVDDLGKVLEVVEDQREDADIEHLPDEALDDVVLAAQSPEQACQRDVDADQDGGEKGDVTRQEPEAAVDIAAEGLHEPVDDTEIIHRAPPPRPSVPGIGGAGTEEPARGLARRFLRLRLARGVFGLGPVVGGHQRLDLHLLLGRERNELVRGLLRLQRADGALAPIDEIGEQPFVGAHILDDLRLHPHGLAKGVHGTLPTLARGGRHVVHTDRSIVAIGGIAAATDLRVG